MNKGHHRLQSIFIRMMWHAIIWTSASFLFGLIRVWDIESLLAFERVIPIDLTRLFVQLMVLGLSIGIPFGVLDNLLNIHRLKKRSYLEIILIKSLSQLVLAVFSMSCLVFVSNTFYADEERISLMRFIFSSTALLWIIFSGIVSFMIYFLEVIQTKVGSRILINLILGRYHNPRVESRIFMFLDMKDSTTHAENLGHIKFSSLIQDSLNDLTSAIINHKVEVYQYVGDEAVLTWGLKDGFDNANCLNVYFTFKETLRSRQEYYMEKYGFVPFFKAGVHLGEVSVSEVGIIKREIAYHSDVLNTAARIQGKCNEFNAELLISEELKGNLPEIKKFDFKHIGGISLKGKQNVVNIFKVEKEN